MGVFDLFIIMYHHHPLPISKHKLKIEIQKLKSAKKISGLFLLQFDFKSNIHLHFVCDLTFFFGFLVFVLFSTMFFLAAVSAFDEDSARHLTFWLALLSLITASCLQFTLIRSIFTACRIYQVSQEIFAIILI